MTDPRDRDHDESLDSASEGDQLEQSRDVVDEPHDLEQTTRPPMPGGLEADPADVVEQAIEVPHDDEEDLIPE